MDWHYVNWDVECPDFPDDKCDVLCRCISPDIGGTPFVSYEVQTFSPSIGVNGGFLCNNGDRIITHWAYFDKPAYVKDEY